MSAYRKAVDAYNEANIQIDQLDTADLFTKKSEEILAPFREADRLLAEEIKIITDTYDQGLISAVEYVHHIVGMISN